MYNPSKSELFFLELEFCLSLHQFCAQYFLFQIEVDKHLQILFQFIDLLFFNDLFDLSVLAYFPPQLLLLTDRLCYW